MLKTSCCYEENLTYLLIFRKKMLRKLVVTVKCVGEENIDAKRCPGVGYR
jgi:hypothetical protein